MKSVDTKPIFIKSKDVEQMLGLSRTSLWRMEREGDFPRRRVIAPNRVAYVRDEIMKWVRTRPLAELPSA